MPRGRSTRIAGWVPSELEMLPTSPYFPMTHGTLDPTRLLTSQLSRPWLMGLASGQTPGPASRTRTMADARASWDASGVSPGDGDDWVRSVSWKIISDGSNQGYSGFSALRTGVAPSEGSPI